MSGEVRLVNFRKNGLSLHRSKGVPIAVNAKAHGTNHLSSEADLL